MIKRNKKKIVFITLLFIFVFSVTLFQVKNTHAVNLAKQLKGKILIQAEQNGEAWYVNSQNLKRYYMGRPDDAFELMRELGVGITNSDLVKIQIADANLSGDNDQDGDGLSDMIEDSIGLSKTNVDSDNDGFDDKTEILNGYNLINSNSPSVDNTFSKKQAGKILLQVKQNGEAWYINPSDNKRYFLGRPQDAFDIMRSLGLGITDEDINSIESVNFQMEDGDVDDGLHENSYDADGFLWGTEGTEIDKSTVNAINDVFKTKFVKARFFSQSFTTDWKTFDTNYGLPAYDSAKKFNIEDRIEVYENNNWSMIPMLSYGKMEEGIILDSSEKVEDYKNFVLWFLDNCKERANIKYLELQNVPFGNYQYFVEAQNKIYDAVKEKYDDIYIGTPGFEYWGDHETIAEFNEIIEYFLDSDNGAKFDFWAVHDYGIKDMSSRTNIKELPPTKTAENNIYAGIQGFIEIRKKLDANGWQNRFIIDTEHAGIYYPRRIYGSTEISEEEDKVSAAYMVQELLLKRTLNYNGARVISGAIPFKTAPWSNFGEFDWGVLSNDGNPSISAYSVGRFLDYLNMYSYDSHISGEFDKEEIWIEKFKSENKELYIYFKPFKEKGEQTLSFDNENIVYELTLKEIPTSISLIDNYGNSESIAISKNIEISAENSPKYLVIEY